jgi:hypothetical protein
MGIHCADNTTPSIRKKVALTSPTSGGRSVGIVRSRTQTMEFSLLGAQLQRYATYFPLHEFHPSAT